MPLPVLQHLGRVHGLQVLVVDPDQFAWVKGAGPFLYLFDAEMLQHLLTGKDLLIPV